MLRVRFIEVSREASRELGVNWFGANNLGNRGFTTGAGDRTFWGPAFPAGRPGISGVDARGNPVPPPGAPPGSGAPGLPIFAVANTLLSGAQPFGVAIANLARNGASIDLVLTALETKGLIRRLAEPDLVALS